MGGGDVPRGAASLRRAAGGSFLRSSTVGSADPNGPLILPDGLALVVRSTRGAQALRPEGGGEARPTRRFPTAAFKAFSRVKDFSRLACLAFPSESSDAFCRMGYARLQLLLGYVVPEVLEEDWLCDEETDKLEEETRHGPPLHVPYRPYVVVSLNGRDVYRSAVLSCKAAAGDEAESLGCLHGVWDERVELQLHHPYSLLRVALFDKDTSEAALGPDELLGALDFQLHLLMPQKIYDIAAFFPPFAVLDEGLLAGKEEAFAVLQGTRRLHPTAETLALLSSPVCAQCRESGANCQHKANKDVNGALYPAEMNGAAVQAAITQQQQADLECCRMRLMLQLLPHKHSGSGKIPMLDELSALLLPAPRDTEDAGLPLLNFPSVWADTQDAKRKLTEGAFGVLAVGLRDALEWERPVLSLAILATFLFLWMHPQFLPAAFLLVLGLLLLVISFVPLPPSPAEGSNAGGKLCEEAAAATGAAHASAARGSGTGASARGRGGEMPVSLKAFEISESSDCSEASLLRSLLSAAVPPQLQLRVRQFHRCLRQSVAWCTYYHSRLCERREAVVGALWVLGAWAAVEPAEACSVARYVLLLTGIAVLTSRLYVVGAAVRLVLACYRQVRLSRQRRGRQHLVGLPMEN